MFGSPLRLDIGQSLRQGNGRELRGAPRHRRPADRRGRGLQARDPPPPCGTIASESGSAPHSSRGSCSCPNTRMITFTSSDVASMICYSALSLLYPMFVYLCWYLCLLETSAPFHLRSQLPHLRKPQADPHAGVRALVINRAVADVPLC